MTYGEVNIQAKLSTIIYSLCLLYKDLVEI